MPPPDRGVSKANIRQYLERHSTLSLATCCDNRAWSTDLFYASDEECCLYFVSSAKTRHCRHIARNPRVSASISRDYTDWGSIKGLQLDGTAGVVAKSERDDVIGKYFAKFPSLQDLHRNPKNRQESEIVTRLLESEFYRIKPEWIRLIDNSKGFGHKEELLLARRK